MQGLEDAAEPRHERSTRAATRFWKAHFPFLKLLPEIRNRIYGLMLVSTTAPVCVHEMPLEKYIIQVKKSFLRRTSYTIDERHYRKPAQYPYHNIKTGYIMHCMPQKHHPSARKCSHILVMAILELNRQTREEAMSVFYGQNHFQLENLNTLLPFLTDRPAALNFMQSFNIEMLLDIEGCSNKENYRPGHGP